MVMLLQFLFIGIGMAIGDICMKLWIDQGGKWAIPVIGWYIAGILFYGGSLTWYAFLLRVTDFSVATILPLIINLLVITFLGIFFFKDEVSLVRIAGITCGLLAVILLSYKK